MEKHDDAPQDVKRATPVEREIRRGQKDDTFEGYPRIVEKKKRWEHCDKPPSKRIKQTAKSNGECCEQGRGKRQKTAKFAMISVFDKPCTFPKLDIVPRHCLTKQKYIDMLATPSRKCPPDCHKKTVLRKLKPVSQRIKELAQPTRQRMLITLQEGAATLPTALLDNLVRTLENETCLTPEQAAAISRKKKFRKKEKGRKSKWQSKETSKSRKSRKSNIGVTSAGSTFDKDSVTCQYLIAERFVRSILKWKCPVPNVELNDISEVIIGRLVDTLEYDTPRNEDRKSQQVNFLADAIACWVAGVLSEVAQNQEKKLIERCQRKEEEMKADEETEEETDEDEEKEDDKDKRRDEEEDEEEQDRESKETDESRMEEETEEEQDEIEEKRDKVTEEMEEQEADIVEETEEMPTDKADETDEKAAEEAETELAEPPETETETETEAQVDTVAVPETEDDTEVKIEAEAEAETKTETESKLDDPITAAEEQQAKIDTDATGETDDAGEQATTEVTSKAETEIETEIPTTEEHVEPEIEITGEEAVEELPTESVAEQIEEPIVEDAKEKEEITDESELPEEQLDASVPEEAEKEEEKVEALEAEEESALQVKETVETEIPKDVIKDLTELFKSDIPFLTFGKIIDTIYKMIEDTPENTGKDPITNGIHRAIYEKLTDIAMLENPELLTDELKDVMYTVCGKIANWLRSILSKSQLTFMKQFVPEVESKEIRDWTKWLWYISDVAKNWNSWLRDVIEKTFEMEGAPITRGEWRDWTKSVDAKALLWRRFHLQIRHRAHRNVTAMSGRRVVKTGVGKPISLDSPELVALDTN